MFNVLYDQSNLVAILHGWILKLKFKNNFISSNKSNQISSIIMQEHQIKDFNY